MMIRKGVAAAGAAVLLSALSFTSPAFGAGANVSGAYDSNYQGLPSGNGFGNAFAHAGAHLPLAGSVGKADDKNPPGQMPDGSDHNNGYECDGNGGVGQTNPAHTGCVPTPAV